MALRKPLRKNEQVLRWLRAVAFGAITGAALLGASFDPASVALALAFAVGVITLFAPGIAVLVAIIGMSLPLFAADFLVGSVFLIIGFAAVQYMGQQNGRVFLLISIAFVGAALGPVWAAAALAGYLLGASEGAIAAILACLALEGAGIVMGREFIGVIFTGGVAPGLVSFHDAPTGLLSFGWVGAALDTLDPGALLDAMTGAQGKAMLVVQPFLWAIAAAIAGSVRRPTDETRHALFGLASAAAGVVFLVVATPIASSILIDTALPSGFAFAAVGSLVVALVFAAAWEWLFPSLPKAQAPAIRPGSMSAEDADVDELLRLIATAEDELASKHTTHAVVMITDMKSFSKMTEEEGSVVSAKTIQRHRDLLLPIINTHNGHGKSTGGDGLVASFDKEADAVAAAAEMQRTLHSYNTIHEGERDIMIRCGVASGEVVLDRGGRPFIGAALNLAARVMNLGDGGQVLVTKSVADGRNNVDVRVYSHGLFSLKNIVEPIEVVEILWADGQKALEPQGARAETPPSDPE